MAPSTIAVSIDLDVPGKRIGHLELVWSDDDLACPPVAIRFATGDIVLARRTMPIVVRGDYVGHVGTPMSDDDFRRGTSCP